MEKVLNSSSHAFVIEKCGVEIVKQEVAEKEQAYPLVPFLFIGMAISVLGLL